MKDVRMGVDRRHAHLTHRLASDGRGKRKATRAELAARQCGFHIAVST
jgi:hypothetical protein